MKGHRIIAAFIAAFVATLLSATLPLPAGRADEPAAPKTPAAPPQRTVEKLAKQAGQSVVVISIPGRDGKPQGLGTGFVVAADGLIATNLHVIGEARPIHVQFADGKQYDATEVHAFDRKLDLAVIRIAAKNLPTLKLGDATKLENGAPVVALGNPHGLKHSVVTGVVSGKREIEGREMIQLAIPIEAGNSGGPVLDGDGRVQGLLTLKSAVTANLGFAVAINDLQKLLEKPNPVPMSKWLTIGAIDPRDWKPLGGANWRQRAGRILVSGVGQGFGGRSLCLSATNPPDRPFELSVDVKLDDETGAAGLVFCADGQDEHYGFYPSNGRLRLSRFEGADVFAWKVLREEPVAAYKPGEWNNLTVKVEEKRIRCFVNGQPAFDLDEAQLADGRVGLAKFRDTVAEFKNFRTGRNLAAAGVTDAQRAAAQKLVEQLPVNQPFSSAIIEQLTRNAPAAAEVLRDRAAELEKQAKKLRDLSTTVRRRDMLDALARQAKPNGDLFHAALLIAKLDNEELDVEVYRKALDRLAADLKAAFPKQADEHAKFAALNQFLFRDNGFHGSRTDYYNKSNSYLNEVLDDREGLPITLSVLYCELGRRVGLKIVGVPLPGHFMARFEPQQGEPQLIDVFDGGTLLSRAEAVRKIAETSDVEPRDEHFQAATSPAILVRMLHNLLNLARESRDEPAILRYLDAILAITPDAVAERSMRVVLNARAGHKSESLADIDWLLEKEPDGLDLEQLREFRKVVADRADP